MKFNIYYGSGVDFSKQELINSFDTMEFAEKFLFDYIKEQFSFQTLKDNMTMDTIRSSIRLYESKIKELG